MSVGDFIIEEFYLPSNSYGEYRPAVGQHVVIRQITVSNYYNNGSYYSPYLRVYLYDGINAVFIYDYTMFPHYLNRLKLFINNEYWLRFFNPDPSENVYVGITGIVIKEA